MNANQKKVLAFGLLTFALLGLFPPGSMEFITNYRPPIDYPVLLILWTVTVVTTVGSLFLSR